MYREDRGERHWQELGGCSTAWTPIERMTGPRLRTITGVQRWARVGLHVIARFRSVRMAGGWKRNGCMIMAVGGCTINRDLATLSAFLGRAAKKEWVAKNVLEDARDERVKVPKPRPKYMRDEDLLKLLKETHDAWSGALIHVAYDTGARRGDLLSLEWERDVDLDGSRAAAEGRVGPHIYIRGAKAGP
jgi:integrase